MKGDGKVTNSLGGWQPRLTKGVVKRKSGQSVPFLYLACSLTVLGYFYFITGSQVPWGQKITDLIHL